MPTSEPIEALDGLRIWGPNPTDHFQSRFKREIEPLRKQYYEGVFSHRSPEEIEHYLGRLNVANFVNPQLTANDGAERSNPLAVAALNGDHEIVALMWGYDEVSSGLPGILGDWDRRRKAGGDAKNYFAINEVVDDGEHDHISLVLGAMMLKGLSDERTVTWYPYAEESELRQMLSQDWGMSPVTKALDYVPGPSNTRVWKNIVRTPKLVFGDNAKPAMQERWTGKVVDIWGHLVPGGDIAGDKS